MGWGAGFDVLMMQMHHCIWALIVKPEPNQTFSPLGECPTIPKPFVRLPVHLVSLMPTGWFRRTVENGLPSSNGR